MNASVKALSKTMGLKLLMEETLSALRVVPKSLHVDASACKGMVLRHSEVERCRRMTTGWAVSCLRQPCTGEPHLHGNDAQVAVRLRMAR